MLTYSPAHLLTFFAMSTARRRALNILDSYQPQRSNLTRLLNRELAGMTETKDRGFIRDLVWAAVRRLNTLDWFLAALCSDTAKLEPRVRSVLRLGLVQVLYFDDMPPYAAVNETVRLADAVKRPAARGLVNAVLRRALREKDSLFARIRSFETVTALSLEYSYPEWMVRRWLLRWGREETAAFCAAGNMAPPFTICVNTERVTRRALQKKLASDGIEARECAFSGEGMTLSPRPELEKNDAWREGLFTVQDEASQLVAGLCGVHAGERVIDLCSGSGIKAVQLSRAAGQQGTVEAVDISFAQLERARGLFSRMGTVSVIPKEEDVLAFSGPAASRVLLDVPCSGLGALRRKPDIKWNRSEEDIRSRFPAVQKRMLGHAAGLTLPGGTLVYSTCTTEPEENEEVISSFLEEHAEFSLAPVTFEGEARTLISGDGHFYRAMTHRHGTDGFFGAILRRAL